MTTPTATIILRIDAPLQSWACAGSPMSRIRPTEREPTKSGVLGLVCAALGWPRDRDLAPLVALRMGVRVRREGWASWDYQTAGHATPGGIPRCNGEDGAIMIVEHEYLADAAFWVGLEGDRSLLAAIDAALVRPVWPLSAGRRSFVFARPVWVAPDDGGGVLAVGLRDRLLSLPGGRLVVEADPMAAGARRVLDVPRSFHPDRRGLWPRWVVDEEAAILADT